MASKGFFTGGLSSSKQWRVHELGLQGKTDAKIDDTLVIIDRPGTSVRFQFLTIAGVPFGDGCWNLHVVGLGGNPSGNHQSGMIVAQIANNTLCSPPPEGNVLEIRERISTGTRDRIWCKVIERRRVRPDDGGPVVTLDETLGEFGAEDDTDTVALNVKGGASRDTYVILRGEVPLEGMAGDAAFETFRVEVGDLEEKEAVDLRRDRSIVEIGRSMPMRLVEPSDDDDDEPEAGGIETWGVQAVGADTSNYTGNGVTVGLLDSGIDKDHAAFAGMNWKLRDFTGEGIYDDIGHGTHCAGTIFGREVAGRRIGVAPGIEHAVIAKVVGKNRSSSTQQVVEAIHWAGSQGAQIISMSLSIDFPAYREFLVEEEGYPEELATSKALVLYYENIILFDRLAALLRIWGHRPLLIGAAGNDSFRNLRPDFKIGAAPPAAAPGVIAVGSVGRDERNTLSVAYNSNTNVVVVGPGVGVRSAKAGGGLTRKSGTSMATPHVAGVAALWAERMGGPSPGLLRDRVVGRATHAGLAAGFDSADVGSGLVQAP